MSRRIRAFVALCPVALFLLGCESKPPAAGLASLRLPDADLAAEVRLAELTASEVVKALHETMKASPLFAHVAGGKDPQDAVRNRFGIEPAEVEMLAISANRKTGKALVSLASRAAFDSNAVLSALSETLEDQVRKVGSHAGVDLHGAEGEDEVALAFPDPRIIAFGTVDKLKRGLEAHRAGRSTPHPATLAKLLQEAPAEATIRVALVACEGPERLVAPAWSPKLEAVESLLITATAGSALDVAVRLEARTENGAKELLDDIDEQLKNIRGSLDVMKDEMGPVMGLTVRPFRKLVNSVRTSVDGKTIEVTATASASVVSGFQPMLMTFMMTANKVSSRLSANETAAIAALRTYLAAQNQFHRRDFYGKGRLVYANPTDGSGFPDLYQIGWLRSDGKEMKLKLIDRAMAEATSPERARAGYYFVDITHDAEGNPYDYSIDCGLCAVPAEHGKSGRNTFVIDVTGVVYMKITGEPVTRYPDVAAVDWIPVGAR